MEKDFWVRMADAWRQPVYNSDIQTSSESNLYEAEVASTTQTQSIPLENIECKSDILTKLQQECINFNVKHLLIKGGPGLGKTYTLIQRIKRVYQENKSIVLLGFDSKLVENLKELVEREIPNNNITIVTIDKHCKDILAEIQKKPVNVANDTYCKKIVKRKLEQLEFTSLNEIKNMTLDYLWEELNWINERVIINYEDYVNASRTGRGNNVALKKKDKRLIWNLYEELNILLHEKNIYCFTQIIKEVDLKSKKIPEQYRFDHVFVDEVQDMTYAKMKIIQYLARESITLVADYNQKIYRQTFSWKEVGIEVVGRTKTLNKSFRNTIQIAELAEDLMRIIRKSRSSNQFAEYVAPTRRGDKPILYAVDDSNRQKELILKLIKELDLNSSSIAIICHNKSEIDNISTTLNSEGINYEKINNDRGNRWSALSNGIKILTAHSSKGLEFDNVIIPYLEGFPRYGVTEVEEMIAERHLLYVAITRARNTVTMITNKAKSSYPSIFVKEFEKKHYDLINY